MCDIAEALGLSLEDDLLAEVRRLRASAEEAYVDSLTGLPNRRALVRELTRTDRRARRNFLLMVDLDRFKEVNDEHGHEAGDELLRHVARMLRSRVRAGDFVARYGGDEFCVMVRSEDVEGARIRLSREFRAPGLPRVGVSVGAGRSLASADRRMYDAKRRGRTT